MAFMLRSLGSLSMIFTTWGSWVGPPDSSVVTYWSSVSAADRKRGGLGLQDGALW